MTVGFELGGMATAWTFAWMGAFGAPCLDTTRDRYRSVSGPGEYTPITPARSLRHTPQVFGRRTRSSSLRRTRVLGPFAGALPKVPCGAVVALTSRIMHARAHEEGFLMLGPPVFVLVVGPVSRDMSLPKKKDSD